LMKRKSQPDTWVFRYYAEEGGRRIYKKKIVGTVIELRRRRDAEKAVMQLRINVNEGAAFAPIDMEQLAAHFQFVELPSKAHSTPVGYKSYLTLYVTPKWGKYSLAAIKSVDVEVWLRDIKKINGQSAAPAPKRRSAT